MQGLLLQLSGLDTDAASALRVIAFFDTLLERQASPRALVQATAGLAQCVVGWRNDNGVVIRLAPGPGESWRLASSPTPSHEADVPSQGVVWLERHGSAQPYDELVLERLALAAGALGSQTSRRPSAGVVADPATVLLDAGAAEGARVSAARTLGLRVDRPVTVVALRHCTQRGSAVWAHDLAEQCWSADRVYATNQDGVAAVIVQQVLAEEKVEHRLRGHITRGTVHEASFESQLRAGVGAMRPVAEAHLSWAEARTALRFAGATRLDVVAVYERLGSLRLLAQIPIQTLRADLDVQAIAAMRLGPAGPEDLAVLQAFCRTGSLRQASTELHLHHSTVASHLARIGVKACWDLSTPTGRLAALSAVYAEHLSSA